MRNALLLTALSTWIGSTALIMGLAHADVRPEQRADFAYSFSDAGGDQVSGPELSVTRHFGRLYSLSALYERDRVKASDVDLAAPNTHRLDETRQLGRLDLDLRDGATLYSAGVSRTSGPSLEASLVRASISQGLFHDLTTLTVGVSRGWDSVYRVLDATDARDPDFKGRAYRRSWWASVDQIVTPTLRVTVDGGLLAQSGDLASPDAGVRFVLNDGLVITGAEVAPSTRTRDHTGVHAKYFMGHRGTLTAGGNYCYDSWGIRARSYDVDWVRPFRQERWTLDVHGRRYSQGHANFYADLVMGVPLGDVSRDRSLAAHLSIQVGTGLTYQTRWHPHLGIQRWTTGLNLDFVRYQYADFRDARTTSGAAGSEPFYRHNGFLGQLHLTGWF